MNITTDQLTRQGDNQLRQWCAIVAFTSRFRFGKTDLPGQKFAFRLVPIGGAYGGIVPSTHYKSSPPGR